MKLPDASHPISIEPARQRITVRFAGRTLARTERALTLREASLPPVFYIPRQDADLALLERTAHHTHCPYKGEASYYTIAAEGQRAENAVWTYESPYPAVAAIDHCLAFYPDRVEILAEPA